jgi:hypothetical protein
MKLIWRSKRNKRSYRKVQMPEPNAAVAEPVATPPAEPLTEPLTEQQITEQYLEKRSEGKVDDLPVPPPGIPDTPPPPPQLFDDTPPPPDVAEVKAVDAYIDERKERKDVKRKARGGKQVRIEERIDQLTREKAEAEDRAAKLEAEKAHTPIPPGTVSEGTPAADAPPVEAAPVAAAEPKPRPRMNEFTDADEYHAAMAMWAVEESTRTGKAVPKVEQLRQEAPPPAQVSQIKKEEFDRFLESGKRFVVGHPDFNTILEAAHVRGLTMSESARVAITRLAAPEVAYWLARPENDLAARSLMNMDELQQVVEVGRIAERLAVKPSDFVSSAPTPGLRLSGANVTMELPLNQINDTDEYIRRRRQERRTGRR